jgi:hypothetical protein
MGLGPTLIGALVGAAVGIGLHQFLEVGMGIEARWFAIVIGILTGLGVRQANKSLAGRVSYLRGAISAVVALAAIVGSIQLVSVLMAKKDAAKGKAVVVAKARPAEAADVDSADPAADEAAPARAAEPAPAAAPTGGGSSGKVAVADQLDTMQFVYMALGALLAYHFGRGSESAAAPAPSEAPGDMMPGTTDPSN